MKVNNTSLATFRQMNRCPKCYELIIDWRKHFESKHADIVFIHYLHQSIEMLRNFPEIPSKNGVAQ